MLPSNAFKWATFLGYGSHMAHLIIAIMRRCIFCWATLKTTKPLKENSLSTLFAKTMWLVTNRLFINLIDCGLYYTCKSASNYLIQMKPPPCDQRFDTVYNLVCSSGLPLLSQAVSLVFFFFLHLFIYLFAEFFNEGWWSILIMDETLWWVFMSLCSSQKHFCMIKYSKNLIFKRMKLYF